jgi:hypothetical protein
MRYNSPKIKFAIIQVTVISLLAAGWALGWLQLLFLTDQTFITSIIAVVTAIGLLQVWMGRWGWVEFIVTALPLLGLLGTIIGIKIAVGGVEGQEIELRDLGVATALNTTIVGMIGALWVGFSERFIR